MGDPKLRPPWSQHYWGIELKIGRINLITSGSDEAGSGRTARQIAAPSVPRHQFPCKKVPFGGFVDTWPFREFGGKPSPFWGPEIGNPTINKIANNSKTVRDREKVTMDRARAFQIHGYFGCRGNGIGRNATPLETASTIKQQKLMFKTLQFLNRCRSHINRTNGKN